MMAVRKSRFSAGFHALRGGHRIRLARRIGPRHPPTLFFAGEKLWVGTRSHTPTAHVYFFAKLLKNIENFEGLFWTNRWFFPAQHRFPLLPPEFEICVRNARRPAQSTVHAALRVAVEHPQPTSPDLVEIEFKRGAEREELP